MFNQRENLFQKDYYRDQREGFSGRQQYARFGKQNDHSFEPKMNQEGTISKNRTFGEYLNRSNTKVRQGYPEYA